MHSSLYKKRKSKSIINIVPLVDVLIVLIFFFLMTMQFRHYNMLDITPPTMETAGKNANAENIVIAINKEGTFFFNDKLIDSKSLELSMLDFHKKHSVSSLLLVVDEETPLKYMTEVIDLSRKTGLENVRLQVR